jgi:hypothetical protein
MRAHRETTPVAGVRGGPAGTRGQSGSRAVDSQARAAPHARRTAVAGDGRAHLGCVGVVSAGADAWAGVSSQAVELLVAAAPTWRPGAAAEEAWRQFQRLSPTR